MHLIRDFKAMSKKERIITLAMFGMMFLFVFANVTGFPLAAGGDYGASKISKVLGEMIKVVKLIFQAVGIMLSVYSVGQLVLAFKNEDADSKSRASTMLVVGIALIALPQIIDSLKLLEQFNK